MPGTYFNTVTLSNYGTQNPFTVGTAGLVSVSNGSGILGTGSYQWTVVNEGSVASYGGSQIGIELKSGRGVLSRTGRAGRRAG
jgi:hypothetical protein